MERKSSLMVELERVQNRVYVAAAILVASGGTVGAFIIDEYRVQFLAPSWVTIVMVAAILAGTWALPALVILRRRARSLSALIAQNGGGTR